MLDRLIQQAVAQVLSPVFDPGFVPVSYGFRPGKSAHDAVKVARTVISQGYRWVVEVDLDAFFDRVNHDALMARVARKVENKRLLKLTRRYPCEVCDQSGKRSYIAGFRVLLRQGRGEDPDRTEGKAFKRMKDRIRVLTSRQWSISMVDRIRQLNRYIRGRMGYFRLSQTLKKFAALDERFRRRIRQIRWKEWKKPRTRVANLRKLGIRSGISVGQQQPTLLADRSIARSPSGAPNRILGGARPHSLPR